MTKPIVTFRNFSNAPKQNVIVCECENGQSYSSGLNFTAVESGDMEPQKSVLRKVAFLFLFIYLFYFFICFHLFVFSPPSPPPQTPRMIWVNHHNDRVKAIHRTEQKTSANISSTFHQNRSIKFRLFQGSTDMQI